MRTLKIKSAVSTKILEEDVKLNAIYMAHLEYFHGTLSLERKIPEGLRVVADMAIAHPTMRRNEILGTIQNICAQVR